MGRNGSLLKEDFMKKTIILILSKLPRYIPSTLMLLLVFFLLSISDEFSLKPFVILYLPLLASDYFLDNGKSLGAIPGILFGIYSILDDLKPPRVGPSTFEIGVVLIIYYTICGICVFIKNKKAAKNS